MNIAEQNDIELLKNGKFTILDKLYLQHRATFEAFAQKYALSQEDIADIYQDVIIAFYENVKKGKLDVLQSSIKTYIFSIGKYMVYNRLKQKNRQVVSEDELLKLEDESIDFFMDINQTEQQLFLQKALNDLGGSCKELIIHFYYHQLSIQKIAKTMGYANENTVKAHKSRCIKSLREIFMEKYAKYF